MATTFKTKLVRPLRGGQITIPAEFRRELNIDETTMLRVTLADSVLRIMPVKMDESSNGSPWLRELYEYFAPVREEILASGITEEELFADIDAAIAEVLRREARQAKMGVGFDTVVFVRGLIGPYSLWGQLVFDSSSLYELIVSPDIAQEYLDVVRRPRIARKFRSVAGRDLERMLDILSKATEVFPPHTPSVCRDSEDDKFLAAAIVGNARVIVTEDKDLLALEEYKGTQICTAETFLRFLDSQET